MWGTVLLCCLLIDARYMLLPDVLTLPLLAMGLIASAASLTPQSFQASCMSAGAAWLVLWTIAKCYHLTTNRHGMGQGDIKLFAALGAWQGLDALPWILLGASLAGTVVGAVSHHRKTAQTGTLTPTRATDLGLDAEAIAFGPYLVLCAMLYQVLIHLTQPLN
jgi:leader peptidase (prepilin peptidase)/N-methyltransferase